MVKKTVKLVPQERFDLIDAQALQQGTLDYVGNALGNLMGYSNGLLSELEITLRPATKEISFETKFAFFVTKPASEGTDGTGFSGEVVLYDPTSPAQASGSVDYTSAFNAMEAVFADPTARDAEGNSKPSFESRLLTISAHAPFLWARPIRLEGQLDARRKWSVAQQTEVPVTMNTRTITAVEFALSASMPAVEDGSSNWAPIAKIVQWSAVGPKILPISAFDNYKWHERANTETLGDVDPSTAGIQEDYFSNQSPNLTTYNIFENYGGLTHSPPVSLVYDMLLGDSHYENVPARQANATLTDRLKQLATYLSGGGTLGSAAVEIKQSPQAIAWDKFNENASNGIVDQLNAIRVALQNSVGRGILDHGAAWHEQDGERFKPYERGGASSLSNLFSSLRDSFRSHWSARPLRSLNSLALENICLADEASRHDTLIEDLTTKVADLERRMVEQEEYMDPFAEVSISDAKPLVPVLSVAFKADYGQNADFTCHAGPAGAAHSVQFFVDANMHSQITYARGGVRIRLSNVAIEELGGMAAISNGQIIIQATPIHYQSSKGWLFPSDPIGIGKVIADNAQSDLLGATVTNGYVAESVTKKIGTSEPVTVVLRAFANFYQCTLNTCVFTPGDGTASIHIYPVNAVPDIVEGGHDLRGYPAFNGWVGRVGHRAAVDAGLTVPSGLLFDEQYPGEVSGREEFGSNLVEGSFFHGDTTNPEHFAQNYGLGNISTNNNANFSFDHVDVFGKMDDLRGYAHTMTFLRPDRFVADNVNVGGNVRPNSKGIVGYNSAHNVESVHSGVDGQGNVVDSKNHGDWAVSGTPAVGANGRFMPSFSLVVYKNTFTSLGSPINDNSIKSVLEPNIEYNSAGTRNASGNQPTGGDLTDKPKR